MEMINDVIIIVSLCIFFSSWYVHIFLIWLGGYSQSSAMTLACGTIILSIGRLSLALFIFFAALSIETNNQVEIDQLLIMALVMALAICQLLYFSQEQTIFPLCRWIMKLVSKRVVENKKKIKSIRIDFGDVSHVKLRVMLAYAFLITSVPVSVLFAARNPELRATILTCGSGLSMVGSFFFQLYVQPTIAMLLDNDSINENNLLKHILGLISVILVSCLIGVISWI